MYNTGIYTSSKLFTGNEWLYNYAVVVNDGMIENLLPNNKLLVPATKHFNCLIPAFIDIQIYGAYEQLFSVFPTTTALEKLYQYCLAGKTAYFLPTIATNNVTAIHACIDAIKVYWQMGGKGCLGLHIEGPWINPIKKGAHIESLIHSPTIDEVQSLITYGKDVIKMITLAPEVCSKEIIAFIKNNNIVVSAGHSNALYEEATEHFNIGNITTVTHLYNAMSGLQHRQPGLVGATLNHSTVMASIIPDGYHVDFAAISIAKKIMQERLFVITDAVTTTKDGHYKHELFENKYESNGTLSGSALTMEKAVLNLMQYCNINFEEACRMCSLYPAKAINLDHEIGKIEVGYKAAFFDWPTEV